MLTTRHHIVVLLHVDDVDDAHYAIVLKPPRSPLGKYPEAHLFFSAKEYQRWLLAEPDIASYEVKGVGTTVCCDWRLFCLLAQGCGLPDPSLWKTAPRTKPDKPTYLRPV